MHAGILNKVYIRNAGMYMGATYRIFAYETRSRDIPETAIFEGNCLLVVEYVVYIEGCC